MLGYENAVKSCCTSAVEYLLGGRDTMMFIPYRKAEIPTSLAVDEVVRRLSQSVDVRESVWPGPWRVKSEYWGKVSPEGFQIVRSTRGRNTYLPLVTGRFTPSANGTLVTARLTLHPVAAVILAVFFGSAEFLCIRAGDGCAIGLLVAFVILHCGMNFFGFYPEEKKSIDWLCNLFADKA
jgi:hypothetical protein